MFKSIIHAFKIKDLRNRILFTSACVFLIKILSLVPIPGIDSEVAKIYFQGLSGGIHDAFKMVDTLSGGAFSGMRMLALSVGPYVSATILVQIYAMTSASIQREMNNSPAMARKKISSLNKIVAVVLASGQAFFFARYAMYIQKMLPGLIGSFLVDHYILFYIEFICAMVAGSSVLIWLSEVMTKQGIGNGISIIIASGILSSSQRSIRNFIYTIYSGLATKHFAIVSASFILLFIAVLIWSIYMSLGQKDIKVIYAKRISGNRVMQGRGSPVLPLRVNYVGVVPAIFASSILMFVSSIAQFMSRMKFTNWFAKSLTPTSVLYIIIYLMLLLTFSYVWTSMQFKPSNISIELKKSGAFIPGVKQGRPTEKHLTKEMNYVTGIGAFMLCVLVLTPWILERFFSVSRNDSYLVGGTTILLLVGTIVDVFSQIEGYMVSQKYSSFSTNEEKSSKKY